MKRAVIAAALAAVMAVAMSGTALAGEVTGKGKPTPIAEFRAGSICAFSGQNDDPNEEALFNDGRVQSFGDIVQEGDQIDVHMVHVQCERAILADDVVIEGMSALGVEHSPHRRQHDCQPVAQCGWSDVRPQ